MTFLDVAQIIGALCVLAGFAAAQFGVLRPQSRTYLLLNLAGSAVLAVLAAIDREPGFLLLEGVWALVSAWGLARAAMRPAPEWAGARAAGQSHRPRQRARRAPR